MPHIKRVAVEKNLVTTFMHVKYESRYGLCPDTVRKLPTLV